MYEWAKAGLPADHIPQLSAEDLYKRMTSGSKIGLVDVRAKREYMTGHIEGSINIPAPDLRKRFKVLDMNAPIVIMCNTGHRSSLAASILSGGSRPCPGCSRTNYRNPLPVAVALLPVREPGGSGLLVVRRAVPPQPGRLALPGGFIDHGEDWRRAVVRELAEETRIMADPDEVRLDDVLSCPDHLLVFGLLRARDRDALPPSEPTDETEGWEISRGPGELAFPLHTRAANAWFEGHHR